MHFLSAVLFAFSANMDNLPLGIAYGMRGIHIALSRNLMIAFITSLGTLASMGLGNIITLFVPAKVASAIGSCILITIGLWFIVKPLLVKATEEKKEEEKEEENAIRIITIKESFVLALALMVNNMGFGIGAKIAGLPTVLTTCCTFVCSLFLLAGGVHLGKRFGNGFLGQKSELISGVIIVFLGIYEFFI